MVAFKLPFFFLTLYFVIFNVNTYGKVLNHSNKISKLSHPSLVNKSSFVGFHRKKSVESNPTTTLSEVKSHKNVVLSKLLDKKNRDLVLVTSGTVLFAVTLYKFVSRLVRYYLYDKYATTNYPGVVNTLGHVLLKNVNYIPNGLFESKVLKPLSKAFENVPFFKGLLRPGMRRVSTSSVLDKDTYVLLYFYNSDILPRLKKLGYNMHEQILSAYESLKKNYKKVELVCVDYSKSHDQSYETFKGLPCYALPFEDVKRRSWMLKNFDVLNTPRLVLLNSDGNVVQDRCLNLLLNKVNDFPWNSLTFQDFLPEYLYNSQNNRVHKSKLEGKYVGLLFDVGNPELRSTLKKKVAEFYEYMNKETNGNFEVIVLNPSFYSKDLQESLKSNHPSWLSVKLDEQTLNDANSQATSLYEQYLVDHYNRFVLLDQGGNVYTRNAQLILDEKLFKQVYDEYSKGADKVKGDMLSYLHVMSMPVLFVFAEDEDPKTQEKMEEEMNLALAKHFNKRKTSFVDFIIVKDKKLAELLRKGLKLKKHKMALAALMSKPLTYDGEVNEKSLLEFLDTYYKDKLNK